MSFWHTLGLQWSVWARGLCCWVVGSQTAVSFRREHACRSQTLCEPLLKQGECNSATVTYDCTKFTVHRSKHTLLVPRTYRLKSHIGISAKVHMCKCLTRPYIPTPWPCLLSIVFNTQTRFLWKISPRYTWFLGVDHGTSQLQLCHFLHCHFLRTTRIYTRVEIKSHATKLWVT